MTKSVLYFHQEKPFGDSPVINGHTGKAEPLYCIPFTLSEQDRQFIRRRRHAMQARIRKVIEDKGYVWASVHWGAHLVLYWKKDNV